MVLLPDSPAPSSSSLTSREFLSWSARSCLSMALFLSAAAFSSDDMAQPIFLSFYPLLLFYCTGIVFYLFFFSTTRIWLANFKITRGPEKRIRITLLIFPAPFSGGFFFSLGCGSLVYAKTQVQMYIYIDTTVPIFLTHSRRGIREFSRILS